MSLWAGLQPKSSRPTVLEIYQRIPLNRRSSALGTDPREEGRTSGLEGHTPESRSGHEEDHHTQAQAPNLVILYANSGVRMRIKSALSHCLSTFHNAMQKKNDGRKK